MGRLQTDGRKTLAQRGLRHLFGQRQSGKTPMYQCGYLTGIEKDTSRPNWDGSGPRPLAWSAWYPVTVQKSGKNKPSEAKPFFDPGEIYPGAPIAERRKFPLVLLSHGTGGTADSLGWLARHIACRGFVVVGVNHHGNTGIEPYRAEGFLCWWERAADLSKLLTIIGTRAALVRRLDLERVSAVGFSLGGYTVLAMAGARTSLAEFNNWTTANGIVAMGPKEFPDAAKAIPKLLVSSEAFKRSWERHEADFTDDRIGSVVAIAAAPPVRSFTAESVRRIAVPVTLITGEADTEAPPDDCTNWLRQQNQNFVHHSLGEKVGHYTFLGFPSDKALIQKEDIFTDDPSVARSKVHEAAFRLTLSALA